MKIKKQRSTDNKIRLVFVLLIAAGLTALFTPLCTAKSDPLKIDAIEINPVSINIIASPKSDNIETKDSSDAEVDLAYVPSETIEYEGYMLGTNGAAAVIALAVVSFAIAYTAFRRSEQA